MAHDTTESTPSLSVDDTARTRLVIVLLLTPPSFWEQNLTSLRHLRAEFSSEINQPHISGQTVAVTMVERHQLRSSRLLSSGVEWFRAISLLSYPYVRGFSHEIPHICWRRRGYGTAFTQEKDSSQPVVRQVRRPTTMSHEFISRRNVILRYYSLIL